MIGDLAMGKPRDAIRRWRQLLQSDPTVEFRVVVFLTNWLGDVGLVVSGGNQRNIAWKYKERLAQFAKAASALGKQRYARAVDLLAEMDKRSKSGLGDASENVERFIVSMAGEK